MAYKYESSRKVQSETCPGVSFLLRKLTEGRRIDLRKQLAPHNARMRAIVREQDTLFKQDEAIREFSKIQDLQDEFDALVLTQVQPITLTWGVKQIEGLETEEGTVLTLEEWQQWPSPLFREVLEAVEREMKLDGEEIKNSQSPTTSGVVAGSNPTATSAEIVRSEDSTSTETVVSISQTE